MVECGVRQQELTLLLLSSCCTASQGRFVNVRTGWLPLGAVVARAVFGAALDAGCLKAPLYARETGRKCN